MKTRIIICSSLLLCALALQAEHVVRVVNTGSTAQEFARDNVHKLVLSANSVDVVSPAGSVLLSVPVDNIARVELTHSSDPVTPIDPNAKIELRIVPMDGEERQFAFSLIGLITFDEQNMYLHDHQGGLLGQQSLSSIRRIIFREMAEVPTSLAPTMARIYAYPVPAQDVLMVEGIEGEGLVRVYSMQGALLTTAPVVQGKAQVPVADLPNGNYLLQAVVEIIKFIKK